MGKHQRGPVDRFGLGAISPEQGGCQAGDNDSIRGEGGDQHSNTPKQELRQSCVIVVPDRVGCRKLRSDADGRRPASVGSAVAPSGRRTQRKMRQVHVAVWTKCKVAVRSKRGTDVFAHMDVKYQAQASSGTMGSFGQSTQGVGGVTRPHRGWKIGYPRLRTAT